VQVLENEQQRLLLGQLGHELREVPEQSCFSIAIVARDRVRLARKGRTDRAEPIAASREHFACAGVHVAQQVHERIGPHRVRHTALHRIDATDRNRPFLSFGAFRDRFGESRFSDARGARDDMDAARACGDVAQPVSEQVQLGCATDMRKRLEGRSTSMCHVRKSGGGTAT